MTPEDLATLSPEDRARVIAHDANTRAIVEKRRTMARMLLAPPAPAQAVKDAWRAVTHRDRK